MCWVPPLPTVRSHTHPRTRPRKASSSADTHAPLSLSLSLSLFLFSLLTPREIDIEDNLFTGSIPREWGNLKKVVEFEVDGNELLAGCIPEGLPKDAEWCGECWSTCPSYDPYCGAYDCNR